MKNVAFFSRHSRLCVEMVCQIRYQAVCAAYALLQGSHRDDENEKVFFLLRHVEAMRDGDERVC